MAKRIEDPLIGFLRMKALVYVLSVYGYMKSDVDYDAISPEDWPSQIVQCFNKEAERAILRHIYSGSSDSETHSDEYYRIRKNLVNGISLKTNRMRREKIKETIEMAYKLPALGMLQPPDDAMYQVNLFYKRPEEVLKVLDEYENFVGLNKSRLDRSSSLKTYLEELVVQRQEIEINHMNQDQAELRKSELTARATVLTDGCIGYMASVSRHRGDLDFFDELELIYREFVRFKAAALFEIQNDNFDFDQWKFDLKARAFELEAHLLAKSLVRAGDGFVYFTDNGFRNEDRAVWSQDPGRQLILQTLRDARAQNHNLTIRRIVVVDPKKLARRGSSLIAVLVEDIVTLLMHGVTVQLTTSTITGEIDEDLFNYAICSSGVIMKADDEHVAWRFAKIDHGAGEYQRMLANFQHVANTHGKNLPVFEPEAFDIGSGTDAVDLAVAVRQKLGDTLQYIL